MKTILGQYTSGQETLVGTASDEIFAPLGGLDTVIGGGGVDTVYVLDVSTRYVVSNNANVNYLDAVSGASAQSLRMEDVSFVQFTNTTVPLWNGNVIRTGPGNDQVMGGSGVDRLIAAGPRSAYTLTSSAPDTWTLTDGTKKTGMDTLQYIDRVEFSDSGCCLDLQPTQPGGKTAEVLHVLMGSAGLQASGMVAQGLALFDQGMSMPKVCQLVVDAKLCPSDSGDLVRMLWRNAVGSEIDPGTLAGYVSQLDTGLLGRADLISLAAEHPLHLAQLQLTGVYQSGLAFEVQIAS